MQLIIGGDIVPTKSNFDLFNFANITALIGEELTEMLNSVDYRIFNLEVPLVDFETPIEKCGPNLLAPTNTINGLKALNPSLLSLANNHILDQGEEGLKSTEKVLSLNEIPYVGVGNTISEAIKPYIIKQGEVKIGVYTCAEHEFTISTVDSPGANPFDPLESLDHIKKLKTNCDYVIVLYHGGKEHYRYPSPYLQKVCRKIVDKGADIVVCQHSHCIGSYEKYREATIVYGQGNFIFNEKDNEFWNTSLLIKVTIIDELLHIDYIPIIKQKNGVRLAVGKTSETILTEFELRSNEILQDGFIEKHYREFAKDNIQSYLRKFSGFGKWLSRIDRILLNGLLLKQKYNKNQLLAIQNYIECEAHRELLLSGLKMNAK